MADIEFIPVAAVSVFRSGRAAKPLRRQHSSVYRQRRKQGLQPLQKPWDFICCSEVKHLAWQAYRVASWYLRDDIGVMDHHQLREAFAESLAEMFKDALSAHAVSDGGCWPVDSSTPAFRNYPRVWEMLAQDVPKSWRPEYRFYADQRGAS